MSDYGGRGGGHYRGGRGGRGGGGYRGGRGGGRGGGGFQTGGKRSANGQDFDSDGPHPPMQHNGVAEDETVLRRWFQQRDGGPYPALNDLRNRLFSLDDAANITLSFSSIQADPFAPGSQVVVTVPRSFPAELLHQKSPAREELSEDQEDLNDVRRVAAQDFLLRHVYKVLNSHSAIEMLAPSQHVLDRSALTILGDKITLRCRVKMPGRGRRIEGHECNRILDTVLAGVRNSISNVDLDALTDHVNSVEEQQWLRNQLSQEGLVAFVADGSILPRCAGDSDRPLAKGAVVFNSPDSMQHEFTLPLSGRQLTGMGIKKGVTLIAGGGFHGKSTLLRALEVGIYNHIPGDGREFVSMDPTAVKIRAEDRRSAASVDISAFINNIPFGKNTANFSTADASGSTSQATNIIEALEMEAKALLIDEDTSATNFMIRDELMKTLIAADREPITPFTDRVRQLHDQLGVSSILVVGGSGQFFALADTVIAMDAYTPVDVTARAKEIAAAAPAATKTTAEETSMDLFERAARGVDARATFSALSKADRPKASASSKSSIGFGQETIDVALVEQLVEKGQTNAIAMCLSHLSEKLQNDNFVRAKLGEHGVGSNIGEKIPLPMLVRWAHEDMCKASLHLQPRVFYSPAGFCAKPRKMEIAAALNRLRTLKIFPL